jgi:hypothetical protein
MANKAYIIRAFVKDNKVTYNKEVITGNATIQPQGCTSVFIENDKDSTNTLFWGGVPIYPGASRSFANDPGIEIVSDFNLNF